MPYTLSMALLWVVLAVLLGIVTGWLMRSVVAKRQIERARSNHLDSVELERLRSRAAELETAASERDRLQVELDAYRSAAEPTAATDRSDATGTDTGPVASGDAWAGAVVAISDDSPDLVAAAAVLGTRIEHDDLTVIDGIGPNIADLCTGIGIQTWRDLAQTEVSLLRTMLDDAGPRFKSHDPTTWPEQAALLAAGQWTDFRERTAIPDGGPSDDGRSVE